MDLRLDKEEVCTFFRRLYPDSDWPGAIFVDFMHDVVASKDGKATQKLDDRKWIIDIPSLDNINILEWYNHQLVHKSNVFFTCNYINFGSQKRDKLNVAGCSILWADVDYIEEYKFKNILERCNLVPTLVNRTSENGYHFFWRLDRIYTEVEPKGLIEQALVRTHKWVPGDKTHNTNRILRVAGTYNLKEKYGDNPPKCETVYYSDSTYTLKEVLAQPISYYQIRLPEAFKDQYIMSGFSPQTKGDGAPDRSVRDFMIAKEMLSKKHSVIEITEVLTNPEFKCSNKALDPKTWKEYVDNTIAKAQEDVVIISTGVKINDDPLKGVIVKNSINKIMGVESVEISNFCIVPKQKMLVLNEFQEVEEELVQCEFRSGDRYRDVTLKTEDLLGWQNLIKKVGSTFTSFQGSQVDFQLYLAYLATKDVPLVNATKIMGWNNESFVTPQGSIYGSPIAFVDNGFNPHMEISTETLKLDSEFYKRLFDYVHKLHNPSTSVLAIGWMLATIFAPQIRKKYQNQFPIACFHGDKGTGKTHMARILMKSLFGVLHDFSGKTTGAVMLRALHYTNALPVLIDEFEQIDARSLDIYSVLRSLYQAGYAQRMRTGVNANGEVININLRAPTVVTCMAGIDDEPAQDRAINLRFTPFNKVDGREATKWFNNLPTGAFLKSWITEPQDWIPYIKFYLDRVEATDRQQFCFATVCSVLCYLGDTYKIDGLKSALIEKYWGKDNEDIPVKNSMGAIDQIVAYLISTLNLLPGNPGFSLDGQQMIIHKAYVTNQAMKFADQIKLNFPITRQWFQRAFLDGKVTGEVADTNARKYLEKQLCACYVINLKFFPLVQEAYKAVMNKHGGL